MGTNTPLADRLRKWLPLVAVLLVAVAVEIRSGDRSSAETPDLTIAAEPIEPHLRLLALESPQQSRPTISDGDRVDVYSADPLTAQVILIGVDLRVIEVDEMRVVVAAPPDTIEAVAAQAGYGAFTLVSGP